MAQQIKFATYDKTGSRQGDDTAEALLGISGSLLALLGVVLAIAGSMSPSGGGFYTFVGFGLIVSGAMLAKRNPAGAWTYLAVVAATLIWSVPDTASGGAALAYRLIGPVTLLLMLALLTPALLRWSRRRTVIVFAALILGTITIGDWFAESDDPSPGMAAASKVNPPAKQIGVL